MFVFMQEITFILGNIRKNCCNQSSYIWLKYAPDRSLAAWDLVSDPTEKFTEFSVKANSAFHFSGVSK